MSNVCWPNTKYVYKNHIYVIFDFEVILRRTYFEQKIFCQYEFYGDSDISRTQMGEDMSKINFQKLIAYEKIDKRVIIK